jgi:hypothetical protein
MQKIPLSLAEPGMILAKPVLREGGLVLVAEGTELSEALLGRLKSMEIEAVTVEGAPVNLDGPGGDASAVARLARLDHLFRRLAVDPFMARVKEALHQYFQLKAASGRGAPKDCR